MKKIYVGLALAAILASAPRSLAAEPAALSEAMALFQKGAYSQSIAAADKIKGGDQETRAAVELFLATAYSKMQAFDKAIPHYERAERLKSDAENLHYDYGQALFATQKLQDAETQFKKSILKKFKQAASAYYVGYIRQLLEDKEAAKDFYSRIQKLSQDPDGVKQPALFQIAEMEFDHYNQVEDKNRRLKLLEAKVLPLYVMARDFEEGTPSFEQANAKIAEIEREIDLVRLRMVNGNPIPKKPYTLKLSQELGYDTNVITEADDALVQVSFKDSFVSKTAVFAKYQFNWQRRISIIPEFNGSVTLHSRRSSPRVYQNDAISLSPAIRTKWEHTSRGKPATGLMDLEYSYMLRDYEQQHKWPYYSRSWNLVVGERVTWFATGSTTVKLSVKFSENYNPDRNAYSPAFSINQNVKILGTYNLQNTFTADYLHARNDFNDERNYKLRHSVALQNFFEKVDFMPSLTLNLKDTMKQKGTRGNELLVNPALNFTRPIFWGLDGSFDYSFSKNFSKSKDQYHYTKHEFKFGASYNF